MNVGSLFSGIGGFDLGLERAGMRTVWFCEQDEFCQRVLAKHWPGVPCYPDVKRLVADPECGRRGRQQDVASGHDGGRQTTGREEGAGRPAQRGQDGRGSRPNPDVRALLGDAERAPAYTYAAAGGERQTAGEHGGERGLPVLVPSVDVLCGGFPCQDISLAGKGAGIDGSRSGLWREFARLVGELRPRYVVVENVPALTSRGLDVVLADLAACGFDAEWDHLPASAFGAPHRRDRIWIVAYPDERGQQRLSQRDGQEAERQRPAPFGHDADGRLDPAGRHGDAGDGPVADAAPGNGGDGQGGQRVRDLPSHTVAEGRRARALPAGRGQRSGDSGGETGPGGAGAAEPGLGGGADGLSPWLDGSWEHGLPRVASGVPQRVDRLRALGNSLVPQIAEWIGERIVSWEETRV